MNILPAVVGSDCTRRARPPRRARTAPALPSR